MTTSFEASFLKAMQLLHSPHKGATDQLKAMLDECLAQKKAPLVAPQKAQAPIVKPVTVAKPSVVAPKPILAPADDFDGPMSGCIVCKQVDQSVGNEIVECQECHSLYHQGCHKPSLTNENVKDPRFIWYCSTCTNKRKKAKLTSAKPASAATSSNNEKKDAKEQPASVESSPFKSWSFLKK